MTFGFATLTDLLSWAIALLLAVKLGATFVLLGRDRRTWFLSRRSAALWWAAKLTPFLIVPCLIAVALRQHRMVDAWVYAALMVFVVIAVPVIIWHHFRRRAAAA